MNQITKLVSGVIIGFIIGIFFIFIISRFKSTHLISDLVETSEDSRKIQLGSSAPDFNLVSITGDEIRLSDFSGSAVIINFWATWCVPCKVEMPIFQSRFENNRGELIVLAVNSQDSLESIRSYAKELNLSFQILLDSENDVQKRYMVRGFPTTFVVDPDGILRVQHIGIITEKQLDGYLDTIW